ncbi:Trp biosynthesis-associated membrane protein [Planococcus sp. APC 4015]|nr:Trp biosynthesis-associated membrane protein [Planococcus sp. APC 4015]
MTRRARLLSVLVILAAGALGVISSTQTWLTVTLADGAQHALEVPGASAIPVLAPLSLAVLALGGALSIVGVVLRYAFGVLTLAIAGVLTVLTAQVIAGPATSHVAATVTTATGITGESAVAGLIAAVAVSPWPVVTAVAWAALFAAGMLTLITAHRWRGSGRRYSAGDTPVAAPAATASTRPHDAIDDWDDLSRGDDPTA